MSRYYYLLFQGHKQSQVDEETEAEQLSTLMLGIQLGFMMRIINYIITIVMYS